MILTKLPKQVYAEAGFAVMESPQQTSWEHETQHCSTEWNMWNHDLQPWPFSHVPLCWSPGALDLHVKCSPDLLFL